MERTCECCGTHFIVRNKANRYCNNPKCQRKRKSRWQKQALSIDPLYKGNQADARKRWQEQHPDYWRTYRKRHPQYEADNRRRQQVRNRKRGTSIGSAARRPMIANMDATPIVKSGTYRLVPVGVPMIANMDMVVELSLLSMHCGVSVEKK